MTQHFRVEKLMTSRLYVKMEALVCIFIVFSIPISYTSSMKHDKTSATKEEGPISSIYMSHII